MQSSFPSAFFMFQDIAAGAEKDRDRLFLTCLSPSGVTLNNDWVSSNAPAKSVHHGDVICVPCGDCDHRVLLLLPRPDATRALLSSPSSSMAAAAGCARCGHVHSTWTVAESDRWMRALLSFGLWKAIQRPAVEVPRSCPEDLYAQALKLLTALYITVKPFDGVHALLLRRVLLAEGVNVADHVEADPVLASWTDLHSNATHWASRFYDTQLLSEMLQREQSDQMDVLTVLPQEKLSEQLPASWWALQDDRLLLRGSLLHGMKNVAVIRADEALPFSIRGGSDELGTDVSDRLEARWPSDSALHKRLDYLLSLARAAVIKRGRRLAKRLSVLAAPLGKGPSAASTVVDHVPISVSAAEALTLFDQADRVPAEKTPGEPPEAFSLAAQRVGSWSSTDGRSDMTLDLVRELVTEWAYNGVRSGSTAPQRMVLLSSTRADDQTPILREHISARLLEELFADLDQASAKPAFGAAADRNDTLAFSRLIGTNRGAQNIPSERAILSDLYRTVPFGLPPVLNATGQNLLSSELAQLLRDRIRFFHYLRQRILKQPRDTVLRLIRSRCSPENVPIEDLPLWWASPSDDYFLLLGVSEYGLAPAQKPMAFLDSALRDLDAAQRGSPTALLASSAIENVSLASLSRLDAASSPHRSSSTAAAAPVNGWAAIFRKYFASRVAPQPVTSPSAAIGAETKQRSADIRADPLLNAAPWVRTASPLNIGPMTPVGFVAGELGIQDFALWQRRVFALVEALLRPSPESPTETMTDFAAGASAADANAALVPSVTTDAEKKRPRPAGDDDESKSLVADPAAAAEQWFRHLIPVPHAYKRRRMVGFGGFGFDDGVWVTRDSFSHLGPECLQTFHALLSLAAASDPSATAMDGSTTVASSADVPVKMETAEAPPLVCSTSDPVPVDVTSASAEVLASFATRTSAFYRPSAERACFAGIARQSAAASLFPFAQSTSKHPRESPTIEVFAKPISVHTHSAVPQPLPPAVLPLLLSEGLILHQVGELAPDDIAFAFRASPSDHALLPGLFYPLGFVSVRLHQSCVYPERLCQYKCEILGDTRGAPGLASGAALVSPICIVTCEDALHRPFVANSPQSAWQHVADEISRVCAFQSPPATGTVPTAIIKRTVDGHERFGLYHPAVQQLIQEANADRIALSKIYRPRANRVLNYTTAQALRPLSIADLPVFPSASPRPI